MNPDTSLTRRINSRQEPTVNDQIDGFNGKASCGAPRQLAEGIVNKSVRGGKSLLKEWLEVRTLCKKLDIDFVSLMCEEKYNGKTFLEHIIEKWDGQSANFIFRQLDDGKYSDGKIEKNSMGIVIKDGRLPNHSIGFQQVNRHGYYVGDFFDGERQGLGKLDNLMGFIYEGGWEHNRREGYGKMYGRNDPKDCQSGFFQNGMMVAYEKRSILEKFGFSLRKSHP